MKYIYLILSITICLVYGNEPMKNIYYNYDENGRVIIPDDSFIKGLPKDGGEYWNRLIFERSPYLLQHAANPVDWYPWGEEAFNKATSENKPIFDDQ